MKFDPHLKPDDVIENKKLMEIFHCSNTGGMRRSKTTGTLVIVSDSTKGLYRDEWKAGILYYTGMGKVGDQVLKGNQNRTLYESNTNGVEVHLFEVLKKTQYTYRGIYVLAETPYQDQQIDDNGEMRKVWIFPIKPEKEEDNKEEEFQEKDLVTFSDNELVYKAQRYYVSNEPKKSNVMVYRRNPYLKMLVKKIANGVCQLCGKNAPFIDRNGIPYLEEHHIQQLANGGKDEIVNVVAICPNCHRRVHVLEDAEDILVLKSAALQNKENMKRCMAYNSYKKKNENN